MGFLLWLAVPAEVFVEQNRVSIVVEMRAAGKTALLFTFAGSCLRKKADGMFESISVVAFASDFLWGAEKRAPRSEHRAPSG